MIDRAARGTQIATDALRTQRGVAASRAGADAARFSEALRGQPPAIGPGFTGSASGDGSRWGLSAGPSSPVTAGPAANAQTSTEDAQSVRDEAQDDRSGPGDPAEGSAPSGRGSKSSGSRGPVSDQPLTIRSLNDLLLTVDPAVLALRGGAPARTPPSMPSSSPPERTAPSSARADQRFAGCEAAAVDADVADRSAEADPNTAADANPAKPGPCLAASAVEARTEADAAVKAFNQPTAAAAGDESRVPASTGAPFAQVAATAPLTSQPGPGRSVTPSDGPRPGTVGAVRSSQAPALSARTAQVRAASASTGPSEADQTRFAAQVSRGLAAALVQKGDGPRIVTLRMHPESLGQVRVQLGMEGQSVSARFEAATPEARDLLDRSLGALRSSLESRGLHVERLHVNLAAPDPEGAVSPPQRPTEPHQQPVWSAGHDSPESWSPTDHRQTSDQPPGRGDAERNAAGIAGGALGSSEVAQGGAAARYVAGSPQSPWGGPVQDHGMMLYLGIDTVA